MSCVLRFLAILLLLGSARAGPAQADELWVPPVPGVIVVARAFDPPARRWQPGHRGVDLVTTRGGEVRATGAGTVAFAGVLAGRGVVTVAHGPIRSTYEPVTATVRVGDRVRGGDVLGHLQPGHGRPGPGTSILHWGLRRGDVYLDPLSLLRPGPPRLLPFWAQDGSARPGPGFAASAAERVARPAPAEPRFAPARRAAPTGPSTPGSPFAGSAVVAVMALATAAAAIRRRGPP